MRLSPFTRAASVSAPDVSIRHAAASTLRALTTSILAAWTRLSGWLAGSDDPAAPLIKLARLLCAAVVVMAALLGLAAILRDQALREIDGAHANDQRRIKLFVADVRTAADSLRAERDGCSSRDGDHRQACLSEANQAGRDAVAAARNRYTRDQKPVLSDASKLPDDGQ